MEIDMDHRQLGSTGPVVSAIGLGCMGMSGMYGASDRQESLNTISAACAAGITLLETGDFYGMGHNEMLIAEALKGVPRSNESGTNPQYRLSSELSRLSPRAK